MMKKILTFGLLVASFAVSAQAFSGKGDNKFQIGANIQDHATGIMATYDRGIGENMSIGVQSTYLLNVDGDASKFEDEFDIKARFSANIGSVMSLPSNVDVYPGLNLGLRNFGAHAGVRYFFSDGFGLFTEVGFPIARYEKDPVGYEDLNNQFQWNIGVSFNL
jgi:outer membrane protein G